LFRIIAIVRGNKKNEGTKKQRLKVTKNNKESKKIVSFGTEV